MENGGKNGKSCVGYIRVSTARQAQAVSPEAQRAWITEWAARHECRLLAIYDDNGVSGKRLRNRPGAQEAIALTCREKAVLVFYSLSRLARSARELYEIADRIAQAGADMVSISEPFDTRTTEGRLIFGMMAVVGQFERELDCKRTQETADYLRSVNRKNGRDAPYGFRYEGKQRVPVADEQRVLAIIHEQAAAGVRAPTITNRLNERGYAARNGKPWNRRTVAAILDLRPYLAR